jgi:hypothetical protein
VGQSDRLVFPPNEALAVAESSTSGAESSPPTSPTCGALLWALTRRVPGHRLPLVAAVDTDRLEQVLGPGWQTMDRTALYRPERELETAAGFARTLGRYRDDTNVSTAGDALAALAARDGIGSGL